MGMIPDVQMGYFTKFVVLTNPAFESKGFSGYTGVLFLRQLQGVK